MGNKQGSQETFPVVRIQLQLEAIGPYESNEPIGGLLHSQYFPKSRCFSFPDGNETKHGLLNTCKSDLEHG